MQPAGMILRLALVLHICFYAAARAQSYAIRADVSFLGTAEQHGVVFKDHGIAKPCLRSTSSETSGIEALTKS
jgi:hypothetical protein